MESIIGKVLESKLFGKGIITHEEDGLIWIDFISS